VSFVQWSPEQQQVLLWCRLLPPLYSLSLSICKMASRIAMPDDGSQETVELTLSGAALLTRLLLGVIDNNS